MSECKCAGQKCDYRRFACASKPDIDSMCVDHDKGQSGIRNRGLRNQLGILGQLRIYHTIRYIDVLQCAAEMYCSMSRPLSKRNNLLGVEKAPPSFDTSELCIFPGLIEVL